MEVGMGMMRPTIQLVPEHIHALRCRHGCEEAIVGVFHFPLGCVCLDDRIQALCHHHMARAATNIVHGPMTRLISFGEWPEVSYRVPA